MDYLKILYENPDLADEFDSLFDFFLLDELSPRDDAEGRCTFSLPGMAFARDGSGGEYHLLEDGSIGYYSSEGEAGRLAENMDDLFSLLVSCICWHDCCDAKEYADSKTLEEYGQRQRIFLQCLWIWTAGGGSRMRSASLPMSRWPPFWSGSAKRRSASPCISVCSMKMMVA